jgi:hypothetical protein
MTKSKKKYDAPRNPDGRAPVWGEGQTKKHCGLSLSPEGFELFDALVSKLKESSRSHFIERLVRGEYKVSPAQDEQQEDQRLGEPRAR